MKRTAHSQLSRRTLVHLGALASIGGGELLTGCGGGGSTGGRRIELAAGVEAESLDFINAYGYRVVLRRALLSIGALHYLTGAPVARGTWIDRLFGVRVAHAHPGHYEAGAVLGEMLSPASVDLVAGYTALGAWPGVTGTALSGRFSFGSPPTGAFEEELGEHVVVLEGEATSAEEVRPFRALGRLEDVVDVHGAPAIEGCEFRDGAIEASGSVTLVVRPAVWLDQVDFAEVPRDDAGRAVELEASGTPHKAFARGLKKAAAYVFAYTAGNGSARRTE